MSQNCRGTLAPAEPELRTVADVDVELASVADYLAKWKRGTAWSPDINPLACVRILDDLLDRRLELTAST